MHRSARRQPRNLHAVEVESLGCVSIRDSGIGNQHGIGSSRRGVDGEVFVAAGIGAVSVMFVDGDFGANLYDWMVGWVLSRVSDRCLFTVLMWRNGWLAGLCVFSFLSDLQVTFIAPSIAVESPMYAIPLSTKT